MSIGMPHCEGRGIGAVCGRAAIGSPRTVHHPERACTIGGGTKLVALDVPHSMRIPRQIAMHHRETDGGPAKVRTSFEGDNMLMVPRFRYACPSPCACTNPSLIEEALRTRAFTTM